VADGAANMGELPVRGRGPRPHEGRVARPLARPSVSARLPDLRSALKAPHAYTWGRRPLALGRVPSSVASLDDAEGEVRDPNAVNDPSPLQVDGSGPQMVEQ
jgi:hypothetical protein